MVLRSRASMPMRLFGTAQFVFELRNRGIIDHPCFMNSACERSNIDCGSSSAYSPPLWPTPDQCAMGGLQRGAKCIWPVVVMEKGTPLEGVRNRLWIACGVGALDSRIRHPDAACTQDKREPSLHSHKKRVSIRGRAKTVGQTRRCGRRMCTDARPSPVRLLWVSKLLQSVCSTSTLSAHWCDLSLIPTPGRLGARPSVLLIVPCNTDPAVRHSELALGGLLSSGAKFS